MNAPERYITAREVAKLLGLTPATVLRYHRQGRLPGRRMPGTYRPIRFVWSEIERAWSAERERVA